MNILMVSSFLPYPLYSGGHIRLYNLIKELSKKHTLTLVCEKRSFQTEEDIKAVNTFCKNIITINRNRQWSIQNVVGSGFSSQPFLLIGHKNSQMKEKIAELLTKEQFDLIHVETFYVNHNIPPTNIPIVLIEHNVEYLVYERYIHVLPKPLFLLTPLLYVDVHKMKKWEEKFWINAKKLIAVSNSERELMLRNRPDVEIVPNGVDIETFRFTKKQRDNSRQKKVLFIGDFKWIQNRDTVSWIIKEIWPKLESKTQNLKLWIVGKNIPHSIKALTNNENIIFDENAPKETEEIFKTADILLAPIRVGGGTSYKILEAFASGTPVITTPLGIVGLDVRKNHDVLIGDTAEEFVEIIREILTDEKKYMQIAENARAVIEKKYNWPTIAKSLEAVYESAVKN